MYMETVSTMLQHMEASFATLSLVRDNVLYAHDRT